MSERFQPSIHTVVIGAVLFSMAMLSAVMLSSAFAKPAPQSGSITETAKPDQPVELGDVNWLRNFDDATAKSKEQGKPIAVLFQEVPGCAGCQKYGQQVLTQPLIVEAIEDNFVPVAIYNNTGGHDKQILTKFKEPAWNYQVMRFLDSELTDIIPRKDKVWSINGAATRLASALETSGKKVPAYLTNVLIPESNPDNRTAVFAMYCFWTGEAKLGSLDGVIATEAGFFDGREVVVVKYNDQKIKLLDLVRAAEKFDCAHAVYLPDEASQKEIANQTRLKNVSLFSFKDGYRRAPAGDQKKQIASNKRLGDLNLTLMQRTKLNSSVISKDNVNQWLSPRQLAKLAK